MNNRWSLLQKIAMVFVRAVAERVVSCMIGELYWDCWNQLFQFFNSSNRSPTRRSLQWTTMSRFALFTEVLEGTRLYVPKRGSVMSFTNDFKMVNDSPIDCNDFTIRIAWSFDEEFDPFPLINRHLFVAWAMWRWILRHWLSRTCDSLPIWYMYERTLQDAW